MTARTHRRQGPPTDVDHRFPAARLRRVRWFRAHRERGGADGGCWYFSSTSVPGGGGRFDLSEPLGTCYLAATALAAARERVARAGEVVFAHEVAGVVVSAVRADLGRTADLLSTRAANHGVTGELSTTTDYGLGQAWAAALHAAGFASIRYQPRFSTDRVDALAIFGPTGEEPARGRVGRTPVRDVLIAAGYTITDVPRSTSPGMALLDSPTRPAHPISRRAPRRGIPGRAW